MNPWQLTPQQTNALLLAGEGYTAKEIGRAMGVSFKTVECYLGRARLRMGARNTTHAAVIFAVQAKQQEET